MGLDEHVDVKYEYKDREFVLISEEMIKCSTN